MRNSQYSTIVVCLGETQKEQSKYSKTRFYLAKSHIMQFVFRSTQLCLVGVFLMIRNQMPRTAAQQPTLPSSTVNYRPAEVLLEQTGKEREARQERQNSSSVHNIRKANQPPSTTTQTPLDRQDRTPIDCELKVAAQVIDRQPSAASDGEPLIRYFRLRKLRAIYRIRRRTNHTISGCTTACFVLLTLASNNSHHNSIEDYIPANQPS